MTLTTNGTQLEKHAEALFAAGVRRVNVSLDTLSPEKFTQITRWGRLEKTLQGIAAAKAAGLAIKINAVALKDVNEDEFDAMLAWCGEIGPRPVPDRDDAHGRRGGSHSPISALIRRARPLAPPLDPDGDELPAPAARRGISTWPRLGAGSASSPR